MSSNDDEWCFSLLLIFMIFLKDIVRDYKIWKKEIIRVLYWINLEINKGEFVAIMGPSGSWKSTLMNIIWMLDKPTSWEYFLDGIRVDNLKDSKITNIRWKNIGFIFQNYSLLPRISALDQILIGLWYQWIVWKKAKDLAFSYLDKVWLKDK